MKEKIFIILALFVLVFSPSVSSAEFVQGPREWHATGTTPAAGTTWYIDLGSVDKVTVPGTVFVEAKAHNVSTGTIVVHVLFGFNCYTKTSFELSGARYNSDGIKIYQNNNRTPSQQIPAGSMLERIYSSMCN